MSTNVIQVRGSHDTRYHAPLGMVIMPFGVNPHDWYVERFGVEPPKRNSQEAEQKQPVSIRRYQHESTKRVSALG